MAKDLPIGVIGGGLGGLAAACTLAARGHEVILFEKNEWLGGKAAVLEERGFRFDMGPTILTVPRVLARIFGEADRRLEDELDLIRLDPQWRCFFADGSTLDLREDVGAMRRELETFAPGAGTAQGYAAFLQVSQRLHEVSERFFFWKPVESLRDTIDLRRNLSAATLADVLSLRMGATVAGTVRRRVHDARVAQMLDHFTQYVGSSPYGAPAVLCGSRTCRRRGRLVPEGRHPRRAARRWRAWPSELGVATADRCRRAPAADRRRRGCGRSRRRTASASRSPPWCRTPTRCARTGSCSAARLRPALPAADVASRPVRASCCTSGLDRGYEHLLHHNFVFSRDPEEEFDSIYHRGEPAPDPTCYVAAPARTEPGVAPPGGEALYVLVHTPYLRPHHDWKQMLPAYRQIILDKLARPRACTISRAGSSSSGA